MRLLTLLFFLLVTVAFAAPDMSSVVDLLRKTPASVGGSVYLESPLQLHETYYGPIKLGVGMNAKQPLSFSFSDRHLSINTEKALVITVAGAPLRIKSIYFHEATGKFEVKTQTPLGIGQKTLNAKIQDELNKLYRPKVLQAFRELKALRASNDLHDAELVMKSITNIFLPAKGSMQIPNMNGMLDLSFNPERDRKLKIDQWTAEIKGRDNITATVQFIRKNNKTTVTGMGLNSQEGIRVYGKTRYPEVVSVRFKSMNVDSAGLRFDYDVGAEEVLTGVAITINMIQGLLGDPRNVQNCSPVELAGIRSMIDENMKKELAVLIRRHRPELIKSGISPQLLAALD